MHAIGFWHEISRMDSKEYVQINKDNILAGHEGNFESVSEFLDLPYDYNSIMHYSPHAFSKNGKKTIETLKPGGEAIGQQNRLSALDVEKVLKLYKYNQ